MSGITPRHGVGMGAHLETESAPTFSGIRRFADLHFLGFRQIRIESYFLPSLRVTRLDVGQYLLSSVDLFVKALFSIFSDPGHLHLVLADN